eukprot:scaffold39.g4419.t1
MVSKASSPTTVIKWTAWPIAGSNQSASTVARPNKKGARPNPHHSTIARTPRAVCHFHRRATATPAALANSIMASIASQAVGEVSIMVRALGPVVRLFATAIPTEPRYASSIALLQRPEVGRHLQYAALR